MTFPKTLTLTKTGKKDKLKLFNDGVVRDKSAYMPSFKTCFKWQS